MDYSKIGTKLYYTVASMQSGQDVATNPQLKINVPQSAIDKCDAVLISNSGAVKKLCDGQPFVTSVQNLNKLGELCHKIQKIYEYETRVNSEKRAESHLRKLNIASLCSIYKRYGLDGLYTYFLNNAAAGVSMDSFKMLYQKVSEATKRLGLDKPEIDVHIKQLINTTDVKFLPWKTKGFVVPKECIVPIFTDESYFATNEYSKKHRLDRKLPNGFRDGGRHLHFQRNGKYAAYCNPSREITIVDKNNDKVLNETIKHLKNIFDRNPYMSYEDKMNVLYTYVNELFKVKGNALTLVDNFPCIPIKLGDIIASGAGVCRHKAVTAKVLGDEVGLDISIVRGRYYQSNGHQEAHAWNEIILPNGKKYLFDTSLQKIIDFDTKDEGIERYYTVDRKRMYK